MHHVAIVTGANHGIGAATAKRLAGSGTSVVVTGWRVPVDDNTGTPPQYNLNRMRPASETVDEMSAQGGKAAAIEADLLSPEAPARGRIVSLTSGGSEGFPDEVTYGAAKAALENYTMSVATEVLTRYHRGSCAPRRYLGRHLGGQTISASLRRVHEVPFRGGARTRHGPRGN